MRRRKSFLSRVLVFILCLCLFTENSRGFISLAAENPDVSQESGIQNASDDPDDSANTGNETSVPATKQADGTDDKNSNTSGTGEQTLGTSGTGTPGTSSTDLSGQTPSSQNTSNDNNGTDPSGNASAGTGAGNVATDESGTGAGTSQPSGGASSGSTLATDESTAGSGASMTTGDATTDTTDEDKENADDEDADNEDDDDELTPEEEEALRKWLEENGGIMTLGVGDGIDITGLINWDDSYWSSQTRPSEEILKTKIKLYAVQAGVKSAIVTPNIEFYDAEGATGYRISVTEPDADTHYIVRIEGLDTYDISYDEGGTEAEVVLKTSNGISTGMEASDISASLAFEDFKITNQYYGSGTPGFSYEIKAGKPGSEQAFHGDYQDDGGVDKNTNDGIINIQAADGTGTKTTYILRVPKGVTVTATTKTTGYQTVMTEDKDGDKTTGLVFAHINSNKTVKATKMWNDNNLLSGNRPGIEMQLIFKIGDDGTEQVISAENIRDLGLTSVPVPEVKTVSNNQVDYTFTGLPECVVEGTDIKTVTYTVKEKEVPAGYESSSEVVGGTTVVTNTRTSDFNATIVWKDGEAEFANRPDQDSVQLVLMRYTDNASMKNPETVDEDLYAGKMHVVKNGDKWNVTIPDLPGYAKNGYPYTYYLVENKPTIKPGVDATYDEPTYTNTGDHSQVTDKCFNNGTIVNTKIGTVSYSASYEWKGTDNRPLANIFLYRYLKGGSEKEAAIVRIPGATATDEWVLQTKVVNIAATGPVAFEFTNLPKYDADGKEYVYITKATAEGSDYAYYYIDQLDRDYDYGAPDNGTILFVPQEIIEKKFTLTWNSAAYPSTPVGWTENVTLEARPKDGGPNDWYTVHDGPLYKDVDNLKFDNFKAEETQKEMALFLPKFNRNGIELEYRIVMKNLEKSGKTETAYTEPGSGKQVFEIDGRKYETKDDGNGNLVNSLYNRLEYTVRKAWTAEENNDAAKANIALKSGVDTVTDLNGYDCNYEFSKATGWSHTFVVNRYDEKGRERSFGVDELSFEPKGNGSANYSTFINYYRNATDESKLSAVVTNHIPTGNDKYISVRKVWKDGGDIADRKTVTFNLYEKGTNNLVQEDILIDATTQWTKVVNIGQRDSADLYIRETKVDTSDVQGDNTVIVGTGTDANKYEVDVTGFTITNTRVGDVKVKAEIQWVDDSTPDDRPDITATLKKRNSDGSWEVYLDPTTNQPVKLTLKAPTTPAATNTWEAFFKGDTGDLVLQKYDADGNIINYNFDIDYTDKNGESYKITKEDSNYESKGAGQADIFTKTYTLTRHSSKEVTVHKIWMSEQVGDQPDIFLSLKRCEGIKDVDGAGNVTYKPVGTPQEYDEIETEFGKIETVWVKKSDTEYTFTIRNLEKHAPNGNIYLYYVSEHMVNQNGFVGYYFNNEKDYKTAWNVLDTEYVLSGGYIVNRQEGRVEINGTKQWQNLDPTTTAMNLPEPTLTLTRKVNDPVGSNTFIEDTTFNNEKHHVKLENTAKYSFHFPESGYTENGVVKKDLPMYDSKGRKYIYEVKETLAPVADRVYITSEQDDFAIVNQYVVDARNTREITVKKTWDSAFTVEGAKYPNVTYELRRYVSSKPITDTVTADQLQADGVAIARADTANTGGEKVGEVTLTFDGTRGNVGESSTVTYTFSDLRIASPSGVDYVYKLVEKMLDGYVAGGDTVKEEADQKYVNVLTEIVGIAGNAGGNIDNKTVDFSNRYVGDTVVSGRNPNPTVTITGTKEWHDKGYEHLRPDNNTVELVLYRYSDQSDVHTAAQKVPINGTTVGGVQVTNGVDIAWTNNDDAHTTWTYTITENNATSGQKQQWLLTYAPNGQRYQYKIVEQPVTNYKQLSEAERTVKNKKLDNSNTVEMNTLHNYLNTSLQVTKIWEDSRNRYGLRPNSITVRLQRTTNNPSDPNAVWEDVKTPEEARLAGTTNTGGPNGTGSGVQVLPIDNKWTCTFDNLPSNAPGSGPGVGPRYYYRIKETKIGDKDITSANDTPYSVDYAHLDPTYNWNSGVTKITNTLLPVSLTVTKNWDGDQNDRYKTRPRVGNATNWTITVQLQNKLVPTGGAAAGLADTTGWNTFAEFTISGNPITNSSTIVYNDLPKCDLSGNIFLYRAVEKDPQKNYEVTAVHEEVTAGSQSNYKSTITNKLIVESTLQDVTVQKSWYPGTESAGAKKVVMELQQSTDGTTFTKVSATDNPQTVDGTSTNPWEYTWTQVPKLTAKGDQITYRVVETDVKDGSTSVKARYQISEIENKKEGNKKTVQIRNTELIDYAFTLEWIKNDFGLTNQADFTLYRIKSNAAGADNSAQTDATGWENVTINAAAAPVTIGSVSKTGNVTGTAAKTIVWKDLPKYAEDGTEYIYQVVETKIGGNDINNPLTTDNYKTYTISNTRNTATPASGATKEIQSASITNTLETTTKQGVKKWDFTALNGNAQGTSTDAQAYRAALIPDTIALTLQSDVAQANTFANVTTGVPAAGNGYTLTIPMDKTADWTYKYENLPRYRLDGTTEIAYRVEEVLTSAKSYANAFEKTEVHATAAGNMTEVTNKYKVTTLSGKKTWSDFENRFTLRPNSLTLTVKVNGNVMNPQPKIMWNLAAGGATASTAVWKYSIAGLPAVVWDSAEKKYIMASYTVEETVPVRYWQKTDDVDANKGYNFINQLCVIEIWNTAKQEGTASTPTTLSGAEFKLTGAFQDADGHTTTSATVPLTLTNGRLFLTPDQLGSGRGLIPGRTYILVQETAVAGYQKIVGSVEFTVDKNGVITINRNAEMKDNGSLIGSDAARVIAQTATAPAILQIQNCKTQGKVKLTKVDAANNDIKLSGVRFKLYKQMGTNPDKTSDKVIDAAGSIDDTGNAAHETDANGVITVSGLEEGKYYFVEVETLGNYEVDDTADAFVITSGDHWTGTQTKELTMENTKLNTELRMIKRDAVSGDPIQGVTFKVTFQPAPPPGGTTPASQVINAITKDDGTLVTDDAKATIKLEKGTYTVEEISSVTGYEKEVGGKTFKCTFEIKDGQQIEAVKLSEQWLNSENRGDSSKKQRQIINFQCDPDVFKAFMHKDGNMGDGVYNTRELGSITIYKVDGDDNTKTLNDVQFKLEKKKDDGWIGNVVNFLTGKTYEVVNLTEANYKTTEGGGKLVITGLEWGEYRITEVKPKDGYTIFPGGATKEFTVQGGLTGVIHHTLEYEAGTGKIQNYQTKIQIGVEETYNGGDKKADVSLTLEGLFVGETGITTKTWTSADNAMQELKGQLIVGKTYTLTQTRPAGYEEWKQPVQFHLDLNGNIVFETGSPVQTTAGTPVARVTTDGKTLWVNNIKVNAKLRIEKTGAGDKPLKDIEFKLYHADDTKITVTPDDIKTGDNGIWESDPTQLKLPEGSYYLMETTIHPLYRDATAKKIEFEVKGTDNFVEGVTQPVVVKVKNIPLFNLIDINTEGKSLNGYRFEVTGLFRAADPADPTEAIDTMIVTKDTLEEFNRRLVLKNRYFMKQIGIDNGYILDEPIEFYVGDDYKITMVENDEYKLNVVDNTLIVINRPIPPVIPPVDPPVDPPDDGPDTPPVGGDDIPDDGTGIGGGDTPPADGGGGGGSSSGESTPLGGIGGPAEEEETEEAVIPTFTSEAEVPDPGADDAPLVIMLIRDGEAKLFYKVLYDNRYVYMAEDGEVLGHRRARGGQTGDPIRTDVYILMAAVGSLGVLVATGNHSKKRKKKEHIKK